MCLFCNQYSNGLMCEKCFSKQKLEEILAQLLRHTGTQTENKKLREYVCSFVSKADAADAVLSLTAQYPAFDLKFFRVQAWKNKGAAFRPQFNKEAREYLAGPFENEKRYIYTARGLVKGLMAEYELTEALLLTEKLTTEFFDLLSVADRAECLLRLRRGKEAVAVLEKGLSEAKEYRDSVAVDREAEKQVAEKLVQQLDRALAETRVKVAEQYIYTPAKKVYRDKVEEEVDRAAGKSGPVGLHVGAKDGYTDFVCFDFETTGLGVSDKITEIGAVKVVGGEICERYDRLINPGMEISDFIADLTGITNEMVKNEPKIEIVLPEFLAFCGELPLVAHNAKFDSRFLVREAGRLGVTLTNPVVDTLALARKKLPGLPGYKLTMLTERLGIPQQSAHRAWCDAEATALLYIKLTSM